MNMNGLGVSGEPLDLIPFLALLAHPLLASALVIWVWRQYAWRKKSHELKGEERSVHLAQHEHNGERLLWATGGIILVAFLGRAISGWYNEGDVLSNLFPQSLHGFMDPVGFGLMVYLTRLGVKRNPTEKRVSPSPFRNSSTEGLQISSFTWCSFTLSWVSSTPSKCSAHER